MPTLLTDFDLVLAADREIEAALERIRSVGPDRVMTKPHEAATADEAAAAGILPDVVFIRSDGWTLGAPAHLAPAAARSWSSLWIGVFHPGNDSLHRINDGPFDAMLRKAMQTSKTD